MYMTSNRHLWMTSMKDIYDIYRDLWIHLIEVLWTYKMRNFGCLMDIHWKFRGHLMEVSNLHDSKPLLMSNRCLIEIFVLCSAAVSFRSHIILHQNFVFVCRRIFFHEFFRNINSCKKLIYKYDRFTWNLYEYVYYVCDITISGQ